MIIPTANSYFSGAGLMDMGLMSAGVNMQQSIDLDIDAVNSMRRNPKYFGHRIIHGDIKEMTVLDQVESDIMVFTYPCTKYSTIADIHGTRTGEDLFLHALRHIAIRKPEMYIIENVPGMKKFKVVMETMTKLPDYYVNVFCPLDAQIWVPQRRKRLIVIATRKPFHIDAPVKGKTLRVKDILEQDVDINVPECVYNRMNGNYRDKPIIVDPEKDDIAPTCVAHYAKDLGTRLVKDKRYPMGVRPFTIREYARLQGVPDDYVFENKMSAYRLIGNGVECNMARWIGEQAIRYFN